MCVVHCRTPAALTSLSARDAPAPEHAAPHGMPLAPVVACRAISAVEPLHAPSDDAEVSPRRGPPTPNWRAAMMAPSSAPRPNLAACLGGPPLHPRRPPHSVSARPASTSSSDKEDIIAQDEEHMRHHVQKWLDAAAAVSGVQRSLPLHLQVPASFQYKAAVMC